MIGTDSGVDVAAGWR